MDLYEPFCHDYPFNFFSFFLSIFQAFQRAKVNETADLIVSVTHCPTLIYLPLFESKACLAELLFQ